MEADAGKMKSRRVAAEQPLTQIEVDLDDGSIEMVVSLEVEHVRGLERGRSPEPLKIVVEEVAADNRAIDHADGRRDHCRRGQLSRPGRPARHRTRVPGGGGSSK